MAHLDGGEAVGGRDGGVRPLAGLVARLGALAALVLLLEKLHQRALTCNIHTTRRENKPQSQGRGSATHASFSS